MQRRLLFLFAETPIHAGGSEAVGPVDLPIQREASTDLPVIWGQSLKGALRQAVRDATGDKPDEEALFGSPPPKTTTAGSAEPDAGSEADAEEANEDLQLKKGSVSIGDAQLLLFPAPTLQSCFAWLTSPLLLSRLVRKLSLIEVNGAAGVVPSLATRAAVGTAGWKGQQVFGPFVTQVADAQADVSAFGKALATMAVPAGPDFGYTRNKLATDIVTTDDTTLTSLTKMGTDVVARVQLEPTAKTVANLFYSEHLPAETVLVAVLAGTAESDLGELAEFLNGKPLQLGGDETIGKGVLWCRVVDGDTAQAAVAAALAAIVETPAATQAQARPPADTPTAGAPSPASMPRRVP